MKRVVLVLGLSAVTLCTSAQNDSIQFTWNVSGGVSFNLTATAGYSFIIHWGDWEETKTGTGKREMLTHFYTNGGEYTVKIMAWFQNTFMELDLTDKNLTDLRVQGVKRLKCGSIAYLNENKLTTLEISCPMLEYLECMGNPLTSLILDGCTNLEYLNCGHDSLVDLNLHTNTALQYLYAGSSPLTDLNLHTNTALKELTWVQGNLTTLDLPKDIKLETLACWSNHLPLSELHKISLLCKDTVWISYPYVFEIPKYLGTQTLEPMEVKVRELIDFSSEAILGGVATNFAVDYKKNGLPVAAVRYAVTDGKIMFRFADEYIVTMTNEAIVSRPSYPAKVVVEINVENDTTNIVENQVMNYKLQITENQLQIINYELPIENIEIFDILGRKQYVGTKYVLPFEEISVDISYLVKGVYILKIDNKIVKIIK